MARQRLRNSLLTMVAAASWSFGQTTGVQIAGATAGSGQPSLPVHLFGPGTLAPGADRNVYVAARDGIFKIDSAGGRARVAGTERAAHAMAIDASGNIYIADAGNHRVRKLAVATGVITTIAGDGVRGYSGDGGPATSAHLDGPSGIAVDSAGNVYIADGTADGNIRIRRVAAADGMIATVAGNGSQGYSGDEGAAKNAQFRTLGGLATDALGNLYIADNFNNRIRMVSSTGIVTTVAGNGAAGLSGDGGLARNAELNNPLAVAVDGAGNLFIADSGNFRIRRVNAANGTIATVGNGGIVYQDNQHGFPCSLAFDAAGDLYIADFGAPRLRRVPANATGDAAPFTPVVQSFASGSGLKINVTYDPSVSSTAQAAFNTVVNTYQNFFTTNITVNLYVTFGNTGLGQSVTQQQYFSYTAWRAAMIANANANPGNAYAVAAAASLPSSDPIGNDTVVLNTANARALGLNASVSVDSTITFSNTAVFEYTGVPASGASDFMDTAAHELDEGLGIGSALTGLSDNAPIPGGDYAAEDYFRYSAAGARAITTNPAATVYFSYDGGSTNVAQFNQSYSALGDTNLDRNDWIYGNFGCPSATTYVQDAIACEGQAVAVGSGPEMIVLSALGYDSSLSQTITFPAISNVTFGVAPFTISATASSGLTVSFTSTTPAVCSVSGSRVTIAGAGSCSITANQAGNATYSAAPAVSRSFTVSKGAQTISFGTLPNVTFGIAPFTINATATSGLAVSFASTTTAVCTVSGSTVTIAGWGTCSITASQPGNANYLPAAPVVRSFTVNPAVAAASVSPASGSATTQTFTFTFSDSAGFSNLSVVDVLINNYLDGQQACYLALSPASASSGYLYLVDDAGDGHYVGGSPLLLPSSANLHNNQCTINGTGSSVAGSGNTLTLTLAIAFASGFSGNKIVYMAARSSTQNSGWQALGTWDVPGAAISGPGVGGVTPGRSATMGQTYAFTFTDSNGYSDLAVLDILTNSFLDGIGACYVAYVPTGATTGYLYLVDDAGDGGYAPGSPILLSSGGTLQNSQCTISAAGSSASASGNTLTLNLAIAFKAAFAGNQVFYLAARNGATGNSGWQAVGSVTVP